VIETNTHAGLRLGLLGFVAVLLQIALISQIRILGGSADLSPLVVAGAGFLCGALPGAVFGFAVGIFVDLAFAQTIGVSALLYLLIGYGAGRLRELRAPEAPVTPLAMGAAATAFAAVGYAVIEFLLGVSAPISLLLVRAIVVTIVINSLISVPVYAVVRRWLVPALPEDPRRRRRRRAYTTGGLSPLSRP
jgi:rod shape-determining protein MreD